MTVSSCIRVCLLSSPVSELRYVEEFSEIGFVFVFCFL